MFVMQVSPSPLWRHKAPPMTHHGDTSVQGLREDRRASRQTETSLWFCRAPFEAQSCFSCFGALSYMVFKSNSCLTLWVATTARLAASSLFLPHIIFFPSKTSLVPFVYVLHICKLPLWVAAGWPPAAATCGSAHSSILPLLSKHKQSWEGILSISVECYFFAFVKFSCFGQGSQLSSLCR